MNEPTGITKSSHDDSADATSAAGKSGEQRANTTSADREQPKDRGVPSVDDCLVALGRLPGLIAMKVIAPAQANAIRAVYQEILRQHGRAEQRVTSQIADEDVLRLLREQPGLLSLLEPMLTRDQIDLIMQNCGNASDR